MAAEFDHYASDYEALQKDPLRKSFSQDGTFFFERKLLLIRDYLAPLGRDLASMSWLDIGCGAGGLLRAGRHEFGSATGCDVSGAMLELCPDLDCRQMTDEEHLPFPDQSFDFLSAVCVYHHVAPERRRALTREAARVLGPGGVFAIIEHNPLNPATRAIVRRLPMDRNAILLSAGESRELLTEAGFGSMKTHYFLYLPEKPFRMFPAFETALRRIPLGGQYAVFGHKR